MTKRVITVHNYIGKAKARDAAEPTNGQEALRAISRLQRQLSEFEEQYRRAKSGADRAGLDSQIADVREELYRVTKNYSKGVYDAKARDASLRNPAAAGSASAREENLPENKARMNHPDIVRLREAYFAAHRASATDPGNAAKKQAAEKANEVLQSKWRALGGDKAYDAATGDHARDADLRDPDIYIGRSYTWKGNKVKVVSLIDETGKPSLAKVVLPDGRERTVLREELR